MARLSYEERIKRLKERYKELVHPKFAEVHSSEQGFSYRIRFTNNTEQNGIFQSEEDLQQFINENPNCNIVCNGKLLNLTDETIKNFCRRLDTDTLKKLVYNDGEDRDFESAFNDAAFQILI